MAEIGRREFLRRGLEVAATTGTAILFGGCGVKNEGLKKPPQEVVPSPAVLKTPEPPVGKLPEITREDILRIATVGVDDFNRVLGFAIPKEKVTESIELITTLKEYQEIIAKHEVGYVSKDEIDRPAISEEGKIFLYKPAIEKTVRDLSNTERGRQGRDDFVEYIIVHELAHWFAAKYDSDELHSIAFGKMFVNLPEFKGKQIEKGWVEGAKVKAHVDGVLKSAFQNVEEAEAYIIGDYVMRRRGRPHVVVSYLPPYRRVPVDLINDLLRRIGPDYDQAVKTLARLRSESGGREDLCRVLGRKYNIPEQDHIFFGLSLLYVIDREDPDGYQRLITPRPTIPQRIN